MRGGAERSESVASRAGCRVDERRGNVRVLECFEPARVVRLLRGLAELDAQDERVRELAARLAARAPSAEALARGVHALILQRVAWRRESPETFQSTLDTLRLGYGDCDDHARAIFAILRAAGLRVRLVILDRDGEPAHAVTQVFLRGKWRWMETSVAARFGENPVRAAQRLGLKTRLNMPSGLAGLAGVECACNTLGEPPPGFPPDPNQGKGFPVYIGGAGLAGVLAAVGVGGTLGGGAGAALGGLAGQAADWLGYGGSLEEGVKKGAAWGATLGGGSALLWWLASGSPPSVGPR